MFVGLDSLESPLLSGVPVPRVERVAENLARQDSLIAKLPPETFEVRYRLRYSATAVLLLEHEAALTALRELPQVRSIRLDSQGSGALDQTRPLLGADVAADLGLTGAGVVVAIMDSGLDALHPAFEAALLHEQHFLGQGTDQGPTAADGHGHGSHVAGVIASGGTGGAPRGVAPGVGLVAVRVLNESNRGWVSDWVAGLEHVVELHEEDNGIRVDVVNMSLATNARFDGDCAENYPSFHAAAEAARQQGIAMFAAAGNNGSTTQLTSPSCLADVFSVGMSTKTTPEAVVRLSNRNQDLDLLAPGENISSVQAGGSSTVMTGTSFACPHAVGAAALLLELDPSLEPAELLEVLRGTGIAIEDSGGMSFPRIDIGAAVLSVGADCDDDGVLDVSQLDSGTAEDCNGNGVLDSCDLVSGTSRDDDGDGRPDGCDGRLAFRRGDADADGLVVVTDAILIVNHLFLGAAELPCREAADVNSDSSILVTDAIRLVNFLFLAGPPPALPGPELCGVDNDPRDSAGYLGCADYSCF